MAAYIKTNRREFLLTGIKALAFTTLAGIPSEILAARGVKRLTILHTNDTHSRIDPFPANDPKFPGMGGVARRTTIIRQIRNESENVLLLDAGDIFQGTPYFNLFGGEVEFKAMTAMGYDAATLGNHDFDNGIEGLIRQLPHAKFPFLNINYDLSNTALDAHVEKFRIFERDGIKVGVFGVGIELKGLVDERLTTNIHYQDPLELANKTASHLKNDRNCHLVICLSHLGYRYENSKISDTVLAMNTKNIDLILG